MMTFEN